MVRSDNPTAPEPPCFLRGASDALRQKRLVSSFGTAVFGAVEWFDCGGSRVFDHKFRVNFATPASQRGRPFWLWSGCFWRGALSALRWTYALSPTSSGFQFVGEYARRYANRAALPVSLRSTGCAARVPEKENGGFPPPVTYWEGRLSRDRLAEARAVYCAGVNGQLPQT